MREWLAREAELVGEGIGAISPSKRGDVMTERLKASFMRCDSSGDGRVDATEFHTSSSPAMTCQFLTARYHTDF